MTGKPQDPKEPILREEYERRHKGLRDRYEAFARRSTRILTFLVIVVVATGALSFYLLHQNSQQTKEINGSLVENCEKNGNPLRSAVRRFGTVLIGQVRDQIAQSKAFEKSGTLGEVFAGISPEKLHELLVASYRDERRKIRGLKKGTRQVKPINCKKRYP